MTALKVSITALFTLGLLLAALAACGSEQQPPPVRNTQPPQATHQPSDQAPQSTTAALAQHARRTVQPTVAPSLITPPAQKGSPIAPRQPALTLAPSPQPTPRPTPVPETGGICEREPSVRQAILDQLSGLTCSQVDGPILGEIKALEGLELEMLLSEHTEGMPNLEHIQMTLEQPVFLTSHLFSLKTMDITLHRPKNPDGRQNVINWPPSLTMDSQQPHTHIGGFITPVLPTPEAPDQDTDHFYFEKVTITLLSSEQHWINIGGVTKEIHSRALHLIDKRDNCFSLEVTGPAGSDPYRNPTSVRYISDYLRIDCHPPAERKRDWDFDAYQMDLNLEHPSSASFHYYNRPATLLYPDTIEINNFYPENCIDFPDDWLIQEHHPWVKEIILTGHLCLEDDMLRSAHHLKKVTVEQRIDRKDSAKKLYFPEGHIPETVGIEAYSETP